MRAYDALNTPTSGLSLSTERGVCEEAYKYCDRLIRSNSRTFYVASSLLPRHKRSAVRALYAFCRATDDLIDQMPSRDDVAALLENWQVRLGGYPNAYDPVPLAWTDTKARYQIPQGYEAQLIEGIARDLKQHRYATFAELAEYCYGVASTVGLMVMHIINFQGEAALRYAVKLGIALQLTNILRDVGTDWQTGRLYLPLDELEQFDLREADIALGRVDERWRAFMRYQISRARAIYAEAEPGIALLDPEGRFAIAAAAGLYRAILEEIEAHDYDVFHRRAHVGAWGKVKRIPGIWWTAQTLAAPRDKGARTAWPHAKREGA
ncbi:MAG TPA: squalene/phytoene synthase family protein [Ktedonobacterales bacterium]|nr:squalene/phytoene synthase family protein [Ktedonobacterales bacterium]